MFCLAFAGGASAQDLPSPDILKAIISKLGKKSTARTAFLPSSSSNESDEVCKMQRFDMVLAQGASSSRSYPVLLDRQTRGASVVPNQLFAVIRRVTVDADGSPRSYHPEDPHGAGVCSLDRRSDGKIRFDGICALDGFASGSIHLFQGAEKLAKSELASHWKPLWPLIRDKKLKSVELTPIAGPNVSEGYYFFHWRERNLTAFFKRPIIPSTSDGYPCVHGKDSDHSGYFISATTLEQDAPVRPDGCAPSRFIDAEQIPFFVLPGGGFGNVRIGDIVIARMETGARDRLVFGIVADAGPIHRFGEGSVALNQALLAKSDPVMNVKSVYALDISAPVSVLVLGGTKSLLKGNYTRQNIEAVGRQEFARWNGNHANPTRRLDACVRQSAGNRRP